LTVGNFDGVHAGHAHLLSAVTAEARRRGVPSCVYTFEPPPRVVLRPDRQLLRVMAWPDKLRFLGERGIDQVIVERFTKSFALHPAEWFTRQVLGARIRPSAMVVGYDLRFGRKRAGTVQMLRDLLPYVPIQQVAALTDAGGPVSSSRVRGLLQAGDVAAARTLLGRPHFLRGTVVEGDGRGRTLGFPTANLVPDGELVPAAGVYVARVRIDGGAPIGAVVNIGQRPTFPGARFQIEAHLLDFSEDLYGRELVLELLDRLRDERRFDGVDALCAQISADITTARAILSVTGQE